MKYTRYERARIVGARALQIAMGAPTLMEFPDEVIDPVDMALTEFNEGLVPITIPRD